jgi:hypothetical protein
MLTKAWNSLKSTGTCWFCTKCAFIISLNSQTITCKDTIHYFVNYERWVAMIFSCGICIHICLVLHMDSLDFICEMPLYLLVFFNIFSIIALSVLSVVTCTSPRWKMFPANLCLHHWKAPHHCLLIESMTHHCGIITPQILILSTIVLVSLAMYWTSRTGIELFVL